jgi:hypothetical protein
MAKKAKKPEEKEPLETETDGVSTTVIDPDLESVLEAESDADAGELSEHRQRHYAAIVDLNRQCVAAGYEYEDRKHDAATAKKRYEQLQSRLNHLIEEGPNPQKELPFTDAEPTAADAWKDVPISDAIELTDKQFEKLESAGVRTVGQFEHLRSGQMDGYPDGLRSVKGIGEKTVDAWEDQIVNWLAFNAREQESEGANDAGTESTGE